MSDERLRRDLRAAMAANGWYVARSRDTAWVESEEWVPVLVAALAARSEPRGEGLEGYWERAYWDVVPKLQAALAATPRAPALDVERLGAAWLNVWGSSPVDDVPDSVIILVHDLAKEVAREYAALAPDRQE